MHRVVLKGQSSFDSKYRDSLTQQQQACLAKDLRAKGSTRPIQGTVLRELPEIVTPQTVELYYSSHQSLQISRTATHTVDNSSCEILGIYNTVFTLFSEQGECSLSADHQPARGYCNEKLQGIPLPRPSFNPEIARHMERQMKTDEVRSFFGMPCEVKRLTYANEEKCIAKLPSSAKPATVFTTPLHLHLPGLLLQMRGNVGHLDATEIQLSQQIPQSIFDIELNRQALKKLTGKRTL
jgi:hypothetical protein